MQASLLLYSGCCKARPYIPSYYYFYIYLFKKRARFVDKLPSLAIVVAPVVIENLI